MPQNSLAEQSLSAVQAVPPQVSVVASHTPEMHTRMATSVEQVATWLGVDGKRLPSGTLSWQSPVPPDDASHHCVDMHSESSVQPTVHKPLAVLHSGLSPEHSAELVHCTHVFVSVLHVGVTPLHCASVRQATHRFLLSPSVAQIPERHTAEPLVASHGPSPFA